jgi:hypothetical protein
MPTEKIHGTDRSDAERHATADVGSEGGSPGDVEIGADEAPATGSEAGETARPAANARKEIVRDESGEGRRTP